MILTNYIYIGQACSKIQRSRTVLLISYSAKSQIHKHTHTTGIKNKVCTQNT